MRDVATAVGHHAPSHVLLFVVSRHTPYEAFVTAVQLSVTVEGWPMAPFAGADFVSSGAGSGGTTIDHHAPPLASVRTPPTTARTCQ